MFSIMMTVGGIAPILSPLAGSSVIAFTGWRGVFWALAILNVIMVVGSIYLVKETLPGNVAARAESRHSPRTQAASGQQAFLGFTFAFAFSMAAMFGYIAASPFVFQNILGLGTTAFSLVFALNALGLTITSIIAMKLVDRVGPLRMTYIGVTGLTGLQRRAVGRHRTW